MTAGLDIHRATSEELVAAHRNVFDIWSKGLALDDHIRGRIDSPSHSRATWYVGTLDGRVVTSLGCYPLRFRVQGTERPGMAIGSVYTLAEFRGRGFAPHLIEWVENDQRQRGAVMSVLYSDIEPQYYARRGYTICPSWEGWCQVADVAPSAAGPKLALVSAVAELSALMKLYAEYHGSTPLSIVRDADYWAAILQKVTDDAFYLLKDDDGPALGYVRIATKAGAWRITDYALADQSDLLADQLYQALIASARESGAVRVGGWLPECAVTKKHFQLTPRAREITMIKSLGDEVALNADLLAATNRFCEIDHV